MKKFEKLDEAVTPDGTVLGLFRHDGDYTIRVRGVELMSTRRHLSEERMSDVGCAPLEGRSGARVLIGGLGFGFTARAALRWLAPDAEMVIAELVEAVVRWNTTPEWPLAADVLADPRVTVRVEDVARTLEREKFDAILLDVDNGAESLTDSANALLYKRKGIRRAANALRPGGHLIYWLAGSDPAFQSALRAEGLEVEEQRIQTYPGAGTRHSLFVARRPATP